MAGRRVVFFVGGAVIVLALAYRPLLSPRTSVLWGYEARRAELLSRLQSDRPEERKRGAWDLVDRPEPRALQYLCGRLYGEEPSADVREAYVYALGRVGDAGVTPAVRYVIEHDASAYVRGSAWLALARLDAAAFEELRAALAPRGGSAGDAEGTGAASSRPAIDPWERLGMAQGRAALGDAGGVADLLELAAGGDESLRPAASRALDKIVATALDALGCWPVSEPRAAEAAWPAERIERVREVLAERSTAGFEAALGEELRRAGLQQARPEAFRSLLGRIGGARERIARLLGASGG